MRGALFLFLVGFSFYNCTPSIALIEPTNPIDTIQLCQSYHTLVPEDYQAEVDMAFEEFIVWHNERAEVTKVKRCNSSQETKTLDFYFEPPNYVSGGQNVLATLGNAVGAIALPVALASAGSSYIFGFWFWPDTKTPMQIALSEDMTGSRGNWVQVVVMSPGYFTSVKKQNKKQAKAVKKQLYNIFSHIENPGN